MSSYLKWLDISSQAIGIKNDKSIKSIIIYDQYDPIDSGTLQDVFKEPSHKKRCLKLDIVFHSYFNMPFLEAKAYKYFDGN